MKTQKGNIAVIALIIVVVAITTGVITWFVATRIQTSVAPPTAQTQPVAKPTTSTTQPAAKLQENKISDLKIYRNEKYGFELQYPGTLLPGLRIDEASEDDGTKTIDFIRTTNDPVYLSSGTKEFSAFSITVTPIDKYEEICLKAAGTPYPPCFSADSNFRTAQYFLYMTNFSTDPPIDHLTTEQIQSIRATLKAL